MSNGFKPSIRGHEWTAFQYERSSAPNARFNNYKTVEQLREMEQAKKAAKKEV